MPPAPPITIPLLGCAVKGVVPCIVYRIVCKKGFGAAGRDGGRRPTGVPAAAARPGGAAAEEAVEKERAILRKKGYR